MDYNNSVERADNSGHDIFLGHLPGSLLPDSTRQKQLNSS